MERPAAVVISSQCTRAWRKPVHRWERARAGRAARRCSTPRRTSSAGTSATASSRRIGTSWRPAGDRVCVAQPVDARGDGGARPVGGTSSARVGRVKRYAHCPRPVSARVSRALLEEQRIAVGRPPAAWRGQRGVHERVDRAGGGRVEGLGGGPSRCGCSAVASGR